MANSIELFKTYVPILDEVYRNAALTSVLDGAPEVAKAGAHVNEMIIPMIDMSGMAPYSRKNGYADGDVTLTNQTVTCNYDRGRMFTVDTLDNAETAGIAFGRLAGEFIRVKEVPELDAFRLSTYAAFEGVQSKKETLTTGKAVVEALRTAATAMDETEVPYEDRILFILPHLIGMVEDLDTTSSKAVMGRFGAIVRVPPRRMNTGVVLGDDGYTLKDGQDVNFLAIHKPAVIQYQKHTAPKVILPEANQKADAWKFGYRSVGIASIHKNKVAGVYASIAT